MARFCRGHGVAVRDVRDHEEYRAGAMVLTRTNRLFVGNSYDRSLDIPIPVACYSPESKPEKCRFRWQEPYLRFFWCDGCLHFCLRLIAGIYAQLGATPTVLDRLFEELDAMKATYYDGCSYSRILETPRKCANDQWVTVRSYINPDEYPLPF